MLEAIEHASPTQIQLNQAHKERRARIAASAVPDTAMPREAVTPYLYQRETPMADDILQVVLRFYGMRKVDLISDRRAKRYTVPRQAAMYLFRELTTLSFTQMGAILGKRDHTTVMHGVTKVTNQIAQGHKIKSDIDFMRSMIADRVAARNAISPNPENEEADERAGRIAREIARLITEWKQLQAAK